MFSKPNRPAGNSDSGSGAPTRAPGGGGGGAGGGQTHSTSRSRFAQMSLAKFIQSLPEVVDELTSARVRAARYATETADGIRARAAAADEDQPANQAVAAELYAIASAVNRAEQEHSARMRQLEQRAAGLRPVAGQRHEADRARWDAPRKGSHGVEQKADNRAARSDT